MSLEVVRLARDIAFKAHQGQKYGESDLDYFEAHVLPVADHVRNLGYGTLFVAGALLHDVPEDCEDWPVSRLLDEGVPQEVVVGVDAMTRVAGEDPYDYLRRIELSEIAIVGKFADSWINGSNTALRRPAVPLAKFRSRTQKYTRNIAHLAPRLPSATYDFPEEGDELLTSMQFLTAR